MIEVEKLSQNLRSFFQLLASRRASYIAKYALDKNEGFPLHHHPKVDEYVILLNGNFILSCGRERNLIQEIKLDAESSIVFIVIPKGVLHTLTGRTDGSNYVVIKEFNDTMSFP